MSGDATGNGERTDSAGTTGSSAMGRPGSIAEVVRAIAADLSLLVRQQIELAKQEMCEAAKARARGVGAFVAAGVLSLFGVGSIAGMAAKEMTKAAGLGTGATRRKAAPKRRRK